MRFDPQAGFTPVDSPETAVPVEAPPVRSNRMAKIFLAWLIVSMVSVGIWQIGLPIFAPGVLSALSPSTSDGAEADTSDHWEKDMLGAIESFTGRSPLNERGADQELGGASGLEWTAGSDDRALGVMADGTADDTWYDQERESQQAFERAERLMATGKYADATALLHGVLEHAPDNAQAHYKLGLTCVMQRDLDGARAELETLRVLNPSLASLLGNLVPKSR